MPLPVHQTWLSSTCFRRSLMGVTSRARGVDAIRAGQAGCPLRYCPTSRTTAVQAQTLGYAMVGVPLGKERHGAGVWGLGEPDSWLGELEPGRGEVVSAHVIVALPRAVTVGALLRAPRRSLE